MVEQQTFTEEEVKEAKKWFEFIHKNANWGDCDSPRAQEIARLFVWAYKLTQAMEKHIFEIKKVIPAPQEDNISEIKEAPKKAKK